ncbi:MAG: hypothetical protein ACK4FV_00355 [Candidatus Nitrosocaldus sp.]
MNLDSSKSRDWFWQRVIEDKLISIPSGDRWVTERINYQTLVNKLSNISKSHVNFRTVEMLSIDSYERLPSYLRALDCGIIRLGAYKNTTEFILCKPTKGARYLYLFNEQLFSTSAGMEVSIDDSGYGIITRLLQRIDRLDERLALSVFPYIFPLGDIFNITVHKVLSLSYKRNHTFKFIIENGFEPVEFINGQIEVDQMLLLISKEGQYKIVVLEGKFGSNKKSIAKHKILYSTMVAKMIFPEADEIIPAYLYIADMEGNVSFDFCTFKMDYRDGMPVLTSITTNGVYYIKISR